MSLTLQQMVAEARSQAREITPTEAAGAHNRSAVDLIVDVREPDEFRQGHLPSAINIPRGLLEVKADPNSPATNVLLSSDQAAKILVYCTKGPGARSLLAAQTLTSMGYEHVAVLGGGMNAWAEAGLPVEAEQQPAAAV